MNGRHFNRWTCQCGCDFNLEHDPACRSCKQARSETPDFDGATYDREFDYNRLAPQSRRVWDCIIDGNWWSLYEISEKTGDPTQSVSARLRDFRKQKFGGHNVETRRRGDPTKGVWEMRMA